MLGNHHGARRCCSQAPAIPAPAPIATASNALTGTDSASAASSAAYQPGHAGPLAPGLLQGGGQQGPGDATLALIRVDGQVEEVLGHLDYAPYTIIRRLREYMSP